MMDELRDYRYYKEDLIHKAPKISDQYKTNHKTTILNHDQNKDIETILINNIFDVILIVGYDDVTSQEVSDTNSLLLNFYIRSILDKQKNDKPIHRRLRFLKRQTSQ